MTEKLEKKKDLFERIERKDFRNISLEELEQAMSDEAKNINEYKRRIEKHEEDNKYDHVSSDNEDYFDHTKGEE